MKRHSTYSPPPSGQRGFAMLLVLFVVLIVSGLSFGLLVWFFRVVMSAATQWMTFKIPASALAYSLVTGLGEMLLLGALYGLTLKPSA